jgi:peptidoglycan/LPS O-acetylase OafA/YrhL
MKHFILLLLAFATISICSAQTDTNVSSFIGVVFFIYLFTWIALSFIIAAVFGVARTIGFWGSFLSCLFFSPILGLFITLFFETKLQANQRMKMIELQEQTNIHLQKLRAEMQVNVEQSNDSSYKPVL